MSVLNPVFDNFEETGYEEIAGFSPTFYRQIREMDANFKFGGWCADLMKVKLEEAVDNLFAASMDEAALTRIEEWLYLHANSEYDVETRRKMLGAVMTGTGKFGRQKIIDIVKTYTGVIPTMDFDHMLTIHADITEANTAEVNDMYAEIKKKIPAHILFIVYLDVFFTFYTKEEVTWQNMDIFFPVHEVTGSNFLDGSFLLDGSVQLNQVRYYDLALGLMYDMDYIDEWNNTDRSNDQFIISIEMFTETETDITEPSVTHSMYLPSWGCKTLNGTDALDGTIRLGHERNYDLTMPESGVEMPIVETEGWSLPGRLRNEHNMWFLDGTELLSTDRLVDAHIEEEVF